ncbi:Uncharacterized protein BP5553_05238 [Venustampulla echinocandica]|uniref:Chorismate synthase protein n=1 Tax=Venustampulla echinocandica TaxID=2656787 RepID=A0A370TQJ9_9HELO|nr:Uncharacterized protein BP5553_05238 [Venustampulla echinocandica]RDL37805.1 Uncharacterized protein BP5553_05238 [Venustampulla echinocandica]
MAISWGTIKSLLLFFGPILLPKAIGYYRSARSAPTIHGIPIRPVPSSVKRALLILFVTALAFLLRTLPAFAPENIFQLTKSRIQIPNDVLFARLNALRPGQPGLTSSDTLLRSRINSLESRLLFFQFGPDVLTNCQFCNAEDPNTYLYYFLPALLAPHLFNICVLALVTSGLFTGKDGGLWRMSATLAGGAAILLDVWITATYSYQENARATRLEDLHPFFWRMRVYRFIGLAFIDGLLGWLLYLSSTNRAFIIPATPGERIESSTKLLDNVRSKMNAMSILRNTVNRDKELRERSREYWVMEGDLMGELMEEREVVEGVNNALENRIDIRTISADAETYAENVLAPLRAMQGTTDS